LKGVIIRVVGVPEGWRTPHDGRWIVDYDPDTPYGMLALTTTASPAKARHFATFNEAWDYCQRPSATHPKRPDGRPNRPVSGLSLEFEPG
jgi:hypothetical protein